MHQISLMNPEQPSRSIFARRHFSDSTWNFWWEVGRKRSEHHLGRVTSEYVHPNSHELGAVGEVFFAKMFGLRPADDLNPVAGDNGIDFPNADVKAAEFITQPWLKVRVDKAHEKPDGFVFPLVAINVDRRIGRYCGYATKEMLLRLTPERIRLNPDRATSVSGRPRSAEFGPLNFIIRDERILIRDVPPGFTIDLEFLRGGDL